MKKYIVLTLVFCLLLIGVTPVYAATKAQTFKEFIDESGGLVKIGSNMYRIPTMAYPDDVGGVHEYIYDDNYNYSMWADEYKQLHLFVYSKGGNLVYEDGRIYLEHPKNEDWFYKVYRVQQKTVGNETNNYWRFFDYASGGSLSGKDLVFTYKTSVLSEQGNWYYTSTNINDSSGDVFFPPTLLDMSLQTTVKEAGLMGVLKQILGLAPLAIGFLILAIGLRKALALLQTVLRKA